MTTLKLLNLLNEFISKKSKLNGEIRNARQLNYYIMQFFARGVRKDTNNGDKMT